MRSIEAIAQGRENNFDFIRFVAAGSVILAHAYPLTAAPLDPFGILPNYDLGRAAVTVFFGISGLLITKSYLRMRSLVDFAIARFMRVMPGLVAALLLTAFVLGPIVSSMPLTDYLRQKAVLGYVARNASLWTLQYNLPGVFDDNPYKSAVNGSIWTLPFEIRCYAAVVALGLCHLLRGWRVWIFLVGYTAAYIALRGDWYGPPSLWLELSLPFVVGGVFYIFCGKIPLNLPVLCTVAFVTWLSWQTPLAREIFVVTLIYGVFLIAAAPVWILRHFGRYGDFSYGVYIYGFVVEQTVAHFWRGVTPVPLAIATLMLTLPLAILSWHIIEKPALDRRHALGLQLTRLWNRGKTYLVDRLVGVSS